MRRTWAVGTSLLLVLAAAGLAGDAGTRSPFRLGAGARDLALGGAVLTGTDPATAVYWNPSLLARVDRVSATGFHTGLYGMSTGYQYLGVAVPTMDVGGFGAGLFRLGVDGIERRDANNLYLGEFGESRLALYLGYGRSVAAYDLGVALSLEHHAFDAKSATSSPGLDFAISRRVLTGLRWLPRASAGLNARNVLRPSIKLDSETVRYPSGVDAGVAVDLMPGWKWNQVVTVSARLASASHLDPDLALGLEYSFQDRLHLRAGVRDGKASFGAGLCYQSICLDYAFLERDLGSFHTFSISAGLGRPMNDKRRARDERREAQFNQLLESRLAAQNREAVTNLVTQSQNLMAGGDLAEASIVLERALVLAGDGGGDHENPAAGPAAAGETKGVYAQARELRARLDGELAAAAFAAYVDSAEAKMEAKDYISAKYFAELALAKDAESDAARGLLREADAAISLGTTESLIFENRLRMADSLISYGRYEEAVAAAKALGDVAAGDGRITMMVKKAEFGYWQETARTAFSRGDFVRARAAADSALWRFPDQPACVGLRTQIDREMQARKPAPAAARDARPAHVDEAVRKDVEGAYGEGQRLFKSGQLAQAVTEWEKVEMLAPDYQSVRTYLVNAYKYVGVELYTQNRLQDAVDIWKKAAKLAPGSSEIANYIRRTEGEMARVRELSYERR
jgi:tetratricopeptide (TPR) repeat protein